MQLIEKLKTKNAVIGVVGLGYVGLPLALRYAEVGYRVLGFDIDPLKVEKLARGESYINYLAGGRIAAAKGLTPTTDFSLAAEADALILCVPTPLDQHHQPDLSFITDTMQSLLPYLRAGQVISLESTTYPGTTDEVLRPMLESTGLTVGKDLFLVYSPEREDPGNLRYHTQNIPKVCGGSTEQCLEVGVALYGQVVDEVVPVSSTRVAEMAKLLENIHRAVNIGLVNEMKVIADRMGIDIHEVIRAAATKPFGFVPYYPGPGWGGHCIPIDPFYLSWKAKEYGVDARFIELAGEVNRAMPEWVVNKVAEALNRVAKPLNGSRILILGLAYKKNVDDMRESPAVEIIELLQARKAIVSYSDPHIAVYPKIRRGQLDMRSVELSDETLADVDCVVLVTDHDSFDYAHILAAAPLIVDSRGRYARSPKVVPA